MLLQPITVQFSKSTLKPSVYTLIIVAVAYYGGLTHVCVCVCVFVCVSVNMITQKIMS